MTSGVTPNEIREAARRPSVEPMASAVAAVHEAHRGRGGLPRERAEEIARAAVVAFANALDKGPTTA